MTDEEWRESKFTQEQIHSARRMGPIAFDDLVKHLERFGPDDILDSAVLLSRGEYEVLAALVLAAKKGEAKKAKRRK
jgi:hypothetical protein